MSAVGIGSRGDESSDLDAALARNGIDADEVHGDVFEDGEIVSGMAGTGAHLVIGEDHVHAPEGDMLKQLSPVRQYSL